MSTVASVLDLVESARRRARLAAVLGRLLAEEPGPDVADLVAGVPELAALADPDSTMSAAFERFLIREVPLHESVFTGPDGQRGGSAAARVSAFYERHDVGMPPAWRVAGPDHLGVELWAYGALCLEEAAGWEEQQPDRGTRAVETERELLIAHLGVWAEVAAAALARRAAGTPYAALAAATGTFVAGEAERLRPAPDHPGLPPVEVEPAPEHVGPASLARWLLAPGRSGAFLDVDDLAGAAGALGIPWRPSDPRSRFREVIGSATDGGDLSALATALIDPVEEWRDAHARNESEREGNRRAWRAWRMRAEESLGILRRIAATGTGRSTESPTARGSVVIRVCGADANEREDAAAAVIARLRALDLPVAVSSELVAELSPGMHRLLEAGVDTMLIVSGTATALAWRDGGSVPKREQHHLPGVAIIIRLESAPGAATVDVGTEGDREVRDRVVETLTNFGLGPATLESSGTAS